MKVWLDSLTITWGPSWRKVHGDCKSSVGGALRARTMCTKEGKYLVGLVCGGKIVAYQEVTKRGDNEEQAKEVVKALQSAVEVCIS